MLCAINGWSQTQSQSILEGHIADKESRQVLSNAAVVLLNPRDSVWVISKLTNSDGYFYFLVETQGNYRLVISYLGYESLKVPVQVPIDKEMIRLDTIFLEKKSLTLKLVEIREIRPPMVLKKDTIEFNTDAFRTRQNALLEDLLKRLPSVHLQKDGTLSVQGRVIKKILVEGQPFFGDNPAMALKNLPAGIVDNVQLVEKKSEQAEFTGFSDGNTEKVINITIKNEKKNKFTGRFAAGYGADHRFAGNASISSFNTKDQLSLVASGNNVNDLNFLEGGNSSRGGNGIIRNWNGGINYSKKFSEKLKVNSSYVLNADLVNSYQNSSRQNLLPDSTYYYNQNSRSVDGNTRHKMMNHLEYKPDSLHSLEVDAGLSFLKSHSKAENTYQSLNNEQEMRNEGSVYNSKSESNPGGFMAVFLAKKFGKSNRSLTSFFAINYQSHDQKGYNKSYNLFKNSDVELYRDSIDQHNSLQATNSSVRASMAYSEPIFRDHYLDLTYAYSGDYITSEKKTYDYDQVSGKYNQLKDSLSNSFKTRSHSHFIHLGLNGKRQRSDYGIGLNITVTVLDNTNISYLQRLRKAGNNFYPNAFFNYTFDNSKSLRINYSGFVQTPTVDQLQPVPDNSNPLYMRHGNQDLKMAFMHNSYIWYNAINPKTSRSFSANINASVTSNRIVNSTMLDTLGRQVSRPVNVNGAYNINATIVNAFPIKKASTSINTTTSVTFNHDISYTNGIKGKINGLNFSQILSTTYFYKELLDVLFSGSISYGNNSYSIQKESNANYFTSNLSFTGNLSLPLGFTAGFSVDYQLTNGRAAGYNTDIILLNANFGKSIFSGKKGLIKLQVFDLLDQNAGINRLIGENYIEDVKSNVLRRFFMVSFTYYLKQAEAKGN